MQETIRIDSRFHGPPRSGNGGYSCGLVAKHMPGPAAVRLRIPPPLETDMELRSEGDGLALYHGSERVASARLATVDATVRFMRRLPISTFAPACRPEAPRTDSGRIMSEVWRGEFRNIEKSAENGR